MFDEGRLVTEERLGAGKRFEPKDKLSDGWRIIAGSMDCSVQLFGKQWIRSHLR